MIEHKIKDGIGFYFYRYSPDTNTYWVKLHFRKQGRICECQEKNKSANVKKWINTPMQCQKLN